ncbi:MAG: PQQ-binding-like beta-propeller repeat protein [Alphaproteobacteria bacterium]
MRITPIALAFLALGVTGCDSWFGESKGPPLQGNRIAVLRGTTGVEPDARVADLAVALPRPVRNPEWPQTGGDPAHSLQHLEAGDNLAEIWRRDIGDGIDSERQLIARPVVAGGRIYAMDTGYRVTALDTEGGGQVWQVSIRPNDQRGDAFGGGLAVAEGRVFVTTGYAQTVALDAATGEVVWRRPLPSPARGAPTVAGGRLFTVTVDNQLYALDTATGAVRWTHSAIIEIASYLGAGSPAAEGDAVVATFSSGEIVGFRIDNGRQLWSDSLAALQRTESLTTLSDVRGSPVIDRGLVVAVGNAGRMAAIGLRSGARVWQKAIGGIEMPWVAGDFIYVLTNDSELVCLTRREGAVKWVRSLPRWRNPDNPVRRIVWSGPVLVGDRLVITSSEGEAWAVSPYTGDALGRIRLPGSSSVAPIVANGTLYFITDDAILVAFR